MKSVLIPSLRLMMRRAPQMMKDKFHVGTWSLMFLCAYAAGADNPFTAIDYPNTSGTWAWGINSRGESAGYYTGADNTNHGFLLNGGHILRRSITRARRSRPSTESALKAISRVSSA
jgi:hypothetical protein